MSHALAPIVNACLDIKARALGIPVYELLGGGLRRSLPCYWSRCGVVRARNADMFDGKVIDAPAVRKLDDLKAAAQEARARDFARSRPTCSCSMEKAGACMRRVPPAQVRGIQNSM